MQVMNRKHGYTALGLRQEELDKYLRPFLIETELICLVYRCALETALEELKRL